MTGQWFAKTHEGTPVCACWADQCPLADVTHPKGLCNVVLL
jgi:hypothetical protein